MFVIYSSPQGPQPLVPDVLIDFEDGYGIPEANGGIGGRGSELVQVISPQDDGGGARLVRAPRYWDPMAHWRPGEPIFVPKQANRLVGWPGPRAGGYWTGPMPSLASTSETVEVYSTQTGLTVTTVAGGVVGPEAIRCDVEEGQTGDGWPVMPAPVMTSGWWAEPHSRGTVAYTHAVIELLGSIFDHRFVCGIYDGGASVFLEQLSHRYDEPDQRRVGKIYRGIGPHGGYLYEIWAIARLISEPVGPISARVYLLSSGSASNPARTVIVHGCQMYFIETFRRRPIISVPPFFSHARGTAVVWTGEDLRVNDVTGPWTVGIRADATPYSAYDVQPFDGVIARLVSRNGSSAEGFYLVYDDKLSAYHPFLPQEQPYDGRAVCAVGADYNRRVTTNGTTVYNGGPFVDYPTNPTHLIVGGRDDYWYGEYYKFLCWRRALTDQELLRAFRLLGEPLL